MGESILGAENAAQRVYLKTADERRRTGYRLQKGAEHALDDFCDSFGFVGTGVAYRLHHGGGHSCPAGHSHYRGGGPSDSRTKTGVTICRIRRE